MADLVRSQFLIFLASFALAGCSPPEFYRPPNPDVEELELILPEEASAENSRSLEPVTIEENEKGDQIRIFGQPAMRPFPAPAIRSLRLGDEPVEIGDGILLHPLLVQITEWKNPPAEVLALKEEADYRQPVARHQFFDLTGNEVSAEEVSTKFPQVQESSFLPQNREGGWNQRYFKRRLTLWFRVRDEDGIPIPTDLIEAMDAIDQASGLPIENTSLSSFGPAEYRIEVNLLHWHNGGLNFVLERKHSAKGTSKDFPLQEGTVVTLDGYSVQPFFHRTGAWKIQRPSDVEEEKNIRIAKKVSEGGATVFSVSDGENNPKEWIVEVVDGGGRSQGHVAKYGIRYSYLGPRGKPGQGGNPVRVRLIRQPPRDRIIATLDSIPGVSEENQDLNNLFNQRVPFFYASHASDAMRFFSELVGVKWESPYPDFPRKPEGFPLVMQDATASEIANAIQAAFAKEGLTFGFDHEAMKWVIEEAGTLSSNE